jgi:hypothetical protein
MQDGINLLRAEENIFVFRKTELVDRALEVYERVTEYRTDTAYYKKLMHIKADKNMEIHTVKSTLPKCT